MKGLDHHSAIQFVFAYATTNSLSLQQAFDHWMISAPTQYFDWEIDLVIERLGVLPNHQEEVKK